VPASRKGFDDFMMRIGARYDIALKTFGSATLAAKAVANNGPTPGM